MERSFLTLNESILQKWKASADLAGIPREAYEFKAKIVKDEAGKSDYNFGVILNNYRFKRPLSNIKNCPLCDVIKEIKINTSRNLDYSSLPGFFVIPNRFPIVEGTSNAITEGTDSLEEKMYTTKSLKKLSNNFDKIISFTNYFGFRAFHNSEGAGASIYRHEHWHLTNYGKIFNELSEIYGFESADYVQSSSAKSVQTIPSFPFAHLIFSPTEKDRIIYFLERIHNEIGNKYAKGSVPHCIAQGQRGILITPFQNHNEAGIGAGETAGHIVCKTEQEFTNADYDYCISKLKGRLFSKEEINLEKFL